MPYFQRFCRNFVWLLGLSLAMLLLFQPCASAQSADAWVSPRRQDGNGGWISDRANLIDWSTERSLNRRINKLVGRTRAEMAIATLPQLEAGQSSRAFALNLFNAWGIGNRDTNNGVLLFISHADRRIEIITGTGLGDVLPDAAVSRLIQQEIVPAFRQQDYAKGITQGVNAIAQSLEAQLPSAIFPDWMPDGVVWIPWLLVVVG
ncbi:MAG TPA: TPM domain-containing protein, partial [Allocoleopsis sp.]